MTKINYGMDFMATIVVKTFNIEYLQKSGVKFINNEPYLDHNYNDEYSIITIIVTPITLIEFFYAGVQYGIRNKI